MKEKIAEWIRDFRQQVDSYDYDSYYEWSVGRYVGEAFGPSGDGDEDEIEIVFEGGHDFPMPRWYKWEEHMANVLRVLRTRIADQLGRLVCYFKGHDIVLDEDGPDNPFVDAWCARCHKQYKRTWF